MRPRSLIGFIAVIQTVLFLTHFLLYQTWTYSSSGSEARGALWIKLLFGFLSVSFIAASLLAFRYTNAALRGFYRAAAVWLGLLSFLFVAAVSSWIIFGVAQLAGLSVNLHRMVELLFGAAVMVWTRYLWKARALTLGALVVAIFAGGWWLHSQRHLGWFDANDPGTQYRFLIWKDGVRIIRQHPLLGIGFANVQRHPERFDMGAYRTFPNMISHFHSTPIEIAADCGIPALGIWIWLTVACWREAKRAARRHAGKGWLLEGTALGILGAVAAFQLASLFHYVLGDPEPMLIFWSLVGSAIILSEQHRLSPVRIPVDSH